MAKRNENYTMNQAIAYCRTANPKLMLLGIVGLIFPYFPPYYMGFDPRVSSHMTPFLIYYGVYHVLLLTVLCRIGAKKSQYQKVVAEKAILLGCPISLSPMGSSAQNSYRTTVMINAEMRDLLGELRRHDTVSWQKDEVALAEPFVEKRSIGSGTSARFLERNIPHYQKARKIGEVPTLPPKEGS